MSRYILQTDTEAFDKSEIEIIREKLYKHRYINETEELSTKEMQESFGLEGSIPIGGIPFIEAWLNRYHGIDKENPIEIPKYLRTEEFLKRKYQFMKMKDIPQAGMYFIKNADTLKNFTYDGNLSYLNIEGMMEKPRNEYDTSIYIPEETLMIVSDLYDIQSEYRVYVIDCKIEAISNYNGDATVFPDVTLIKKAVNLINYNEEWLKSYTLDIMVGPKGTAIIEVHNFASVGLYSLLWGDNLLTAYRQGIDYLVNDNKPLEV